MQAIRKFLRDGQAQDLIEYTLIMAFVALASAGLFIGAGGSTSAIWASANTTLSTGATASTGAADSGYDGYPTMKQYCQAAPGDTLRCGQ